MRAVRAVAAGAMAGLALARWRRARRGLAARRPEEGSRGERSPGDVLHADEVPEAVLVQRVRDRAAVPIGVEVAMTEGAIVLFGRIARHAMEPLLERVARVEGVSAVENRLTPVDAPSAEPPA